MDIETLADYILEFYSERYEPISNVYLNRLLYMMYVNYYNYTGKELFKDEIVAWKVGPIVRKIYFKYRLYEDSPIYKSKSFINIPKNLSQIINTTLMEYSCVNTINNISIVVNEKAKAWKFVFDKYGSDNPIPKHLIESMDCRKRRNLKHRYVM